MFSSSVRKPKVTPENHIIMDPTTEHKYSLIWLHGLGDSAHGFADVFAEPKIQMAPPHTKVVLLTAPVRPVTMNMGMSMTSWYDILDLVGNSSKFKNAYERFSQKEMDESYEMISKFV